MDEQAREEGRAKELKRQELGARFVAREVMCCASMLVSDLAKWDNGEHWDDVINLLSQPDYETAGRDFIAEADLDTLEQITEEHGYWDDLLSECGVPDLVTQEIDGVEHWTVKDDRPGAVCPLYDDEDEAIVAAQLTVIDTIREKVAALVDADNDGWRELCKEHDLSCDDIEAYEHWIVTRWLAQELAARGEITGEIYGLSVWGRCATGQSISMDDVIQDIAMELWGDQK